MNTNISIKNAKEGRKSSRKWGERGPGKRQGVRSTLQGPPLLDGISEEAVAAVQGGSDHSLLQVCSRGGKNWSGHITFCRYGRI